MPTCCIFCWIPANLLREACVPKREKEWDVMDKQHRFRETEFVNIFLPISFSICFRCSKKPSHSLMREACVPKREFNEWGVMDEQHRFR